MNSQIFEITSFVLGTWVWVWRAHMNMSLDGNGKIRVSGLTWLSRHSFILFFTCISCTQRLHWDTSTHACHKPRSNSPPLSFPHPLLKGRRDVALQFPCDLNALVEKLFGLLCSCPWFQAQKPLPFCFPFYMAPERGNRNKGRSRMMGELPSPFPGPPSAATHLHITFPKYSTLCSTWCSAWSVQGHS